MTKASDGLALGKIAGRVTAVALALYVVSFVYRSGEELAALALGGAVALYAVTSLVRDVQYGYSPWEPTVWVPVPPSELDREVRQRALYWTLTLKLLLVAGGLGGLVVIFEAGLETLGYVLVLGGLPALLVRLVTHYSQETRPWYPSVPSRPDRPKSER